MMPAFFYFQHTLNRLFNNCAKLNSLFKGGGVRLSSPGEITLKKPSLITVKCSFFHMEYLVFKNFEKCIFCYDVLDDVTFSVSDSRRSATYDWFLVSVSPNYDSEKTKAQMFIQRPLLTIHLLIYMVNSEDRKIAFFPYNQET